MKEIIKQEVCVDCLSQRIMDINCVCTYQCNYPKICLEFELCTCCGSISDEPVKSDFNTEQIRKRLNGEKYE